MKFSENERQEIKTFLASDVVKNFNRKRNKALPVIDIETISNNTWLFIRSLLGCGGSEVAGLMGCSPYTNPIKIYGSKFNYLYRKSYTMTDEDIEKVIKKLEENNPEKDLGTEFLLDFGHFMEEFIREQFLKVFNDKYKDTFEEQFSKKYGKYMEIVDVEIYKDSYLYKHPTAPIFADFDYIIRFIFADGTKKEGVFECKTASSYHIKSKWEETFPEYYNCQVRQYMAIRNVNFFVIACVADNSINNFFAHLGFRDMDYENDLISKATDFWNSVINETVPKVDEDIDALDSLLESIDTDELSDDTSQLGAKALVYCEKLIMLENAKKQYKSASDDIEEQIKKIKTQLLLLCDQGVNKYQCKNTDVEYDIVLKAKKSSRFDKNGFIKAFPAVKSDVEAFTKSSVSTTLSVKKIDLKGAA